MSNKTKFGIMFAFVLYAGLVLGCTKKTVPLVDTEIDPVRIAVASEFAPTAELLREEFTTQSGIPVELTSGTSAELVNMIREGGDFDVFMSSDTKHPKELIDEGLALDEGYAVYALGMIALYSKSWKVNWTGVKYLKSGQFTKIAIANPEQNRYGSAAIETMEILEVYPGISSKLVYTSNESEALDFIDTKKADAGFIAYTSLSDRDKRWAWIVPAALHEPIEQGAVLLSKDQVQEHSKLWMGYLRTDSAKSIIRQSGYSVIDNEAVSSSN
jgi:molybdate transport system substrate-binding protein